MKPLGGRRRLPGREEVDINGPAWGEMHSGAEEFGLLPGEEDGQASDDARHWVRVYQELIEFCELTLARAEWGVEAGHLNRRLCHYRARLRRWQEQEESGPG